MRNQSSIDRLCWALTVVLSPPVSGGGTLAAEPLASRVRQPAALVWTDGGKTVLVANRRSGSLSVIDTSTRKVVAESDVGRGLADLLGLPDCRRVLAVDQGANELLMLEYAGRTVRVVERRTVSPDPVRLVVWNDGRSCVVASRWSRRLTFAGLGNDATAGKPLISIVGRLDLPFCPRELAVFDNGRDLVVADAFGGRLAVVDLERRAIESIRSLPAHNMRGLTLARDGRTLVIAHQFLNPLAQTRFDDVHWGDLIRNHLRVLQTAALLKPGTDAALLDGGRLFDLGDVGYGASDPAGLALDGRGNLIVALGGVNEVAITASPDQGPKRIIVGRNPTAVAPSPDGTVVYVADTLDDTISVVDIGTGQRLAVISLGPRPEPTVIERGERLFHDARLSHDGWMSCQSCHTDGHTNSLASDTLGDGSYGAAKRVPSLLGVAATPPWTWTGSIARLEDQVKQSITTTMRGTKPTDGQVADLTAYMKSLTPPSPELTGNESGESTAAMRGREVFESRKCAVCHAPPEYTTPVRYDVGLIDEMGNREFNPPSLRLVSRRGPLLHDGRARSLDEVFQNERHPRGLVLTPGEIVDLVAFLKTL